MPAILEAREVEKTYSMDKVRVAALKDITLAIEKGEFVASSGRQAAENQLSFSS
jgi:ABC-type lipoprotein export system ATPase subunit